jgi:hypothetical protein
VTDPIATIEAVLLDGGLEYQRLEGGCIVVALPGERRLKTACFLTAARHALEIEAFVMRRPEENEAEVHRFLLTRNARMYGVAWSIDAVGDVYLTGRVPLEAVTPEEVDRILGCVLEYADGAFNTLLEIGFGSSIRREWAWRVKRGEPLANLAAFADFAQRPVPEDS